MKSRRTEKKATGGWKKVAAGLYQRKTRRGVVEEKFCIDELPPQSRKAIRQNIREQEQRAHTGSMTQVDPIWETGEQPADLSERPPRPAQGPVLDEPVVPGTGQYLVQEILDMVQISNGTLNQAAKKAGIPTPDRGQKNFRYTEEQVIVLLKTMVKNCSRRISKACNSELEKIAKRSENQR